MVKGTTYVENLTLIFIPLFVIFVALHLSKISNILAKGLLCDGTLGKIREKIYNLLGFKLLIKPSRALEDRTYVLVNNIHKNT